MKITCLRMLALGLVALSAAACTAARLVAGPAPQNQDPTPHPVSRPAEFPRGRFSAISAPNMVVLYIENDGSFRLYLDNALLDTGRFGAAAEQVLVESMTCAQEGFKPALYEWLYDNETGLAFEQIGSDPCPARRAYLSEGYVMDFLFVFNAAGRTAAGEQLW